MSVTRDGGTYRVSLGDEWITFAPEKLKGQLKEAIIKRGQFGDVLTGGYEDTIRYDIAHSDGVEPVVDGWRFKGLSGPLGVFMHGWRAEFGDRVTVTDNQVTLDAAGLVGELDLDPDTVLAEGVETLLCTGTDWPSAISPGDDGDITHATFNAPYLDADPSASTARRAFLTFDTSGLPVGTVAAATLRLKTIDGTFTPAGTSLELYTTSPWSGSLPNTMAAWNRSAVHRQTVDVSPWVRDTEYNTALDNPNDVVIANGVDKTALSFRSNWDKDATQPGGLRRVRFLGKFAADADKPALIITMQAAAPAKHINHRRTGRRVS